MGSVRDAFNSAWADGPTGSPAQPEKSVIRGVGATIDAALSSAINGVVIGGAVVYATRAALYADLAHPAGRLGVVYNDGTASYNGVYVKSGASGSGSWAITAIALPATFAADLAEAIADISDLQSGKLDNTIASDRLLGRDSAGTGAVEAISLTNGLAFTGSGQIGLADMPQGTFKGRMADGGTGAPTNLTAAQAKNVLGLDNVDNTSDAAKPLSNAAINEAVYGSIIDLTNVAGSGGAYTADIRSSQAAVTINNGTKFAFVPNHANPGAVTLTIGATTYDITGVQGAALAGGELKANRVYILRRGSSTSMRLVGVATGTDIGLGKIDEITVTGLTPLVQDGARAHLWLDAIGHLGGRGLTASMRASAISDIATPVNPTGPRTPILTSGGNVLLWLEEDGVHGQGLSPGLSTAEIEATYAKKGWAGDLPASTDGRTLTRVRRKAAERRGGGASPLRVALHGDSWSQGNPIPTAMASYLAEIFGDCGKSWVHAATSGHWAGVTVTASANWSWVDADTATGWPYGSSPDGQMGWTDRNDDTLTIVTPSCTEARIYTRQHGGTWRYRVDGGAYTTVNETTGGALTTTVITGLSAGSHTVDIDATGNAGVVAWCGMDTRTAGAKAEVIKLGNGGLTGLDMRTYITGTADIWADLAPDIVITILGTNDYIYADSTVAEFRAALDDMVSTIRPAVPGVGFVLVAPALSPTTPVTPLSAYRDAMYSSALSLDADYLSAYDLIAPYADDPALWQNDRHLNQLGGDVLARLINNRLMGL